MKKAEGDRPETPQPQKPSVGRIVLYFDNSAKPHPSIITSVPEVPGQVVACLKVWFDGGRDSWVQNVLHNPSDQIIPNTWKWPKRI